MQPPYLTLPDLPYQLTIKQSINQHSPFPCGSLQLLLPFRVGSANLGCADDPLRERLAMTLETRTAGAAP